MPRLLHISFLLLLSITTFAQRMPVGVTTILTPPYTPSLSAMAESGSTRLMVNLMINDLTISNLPAKLHIKLESNGITIESKAMQNVSPLLLNGGEATTLMGDDIAPYLRLDNLDFKGFTKQAYQKTGQLPSGLWKISVSVKHFHTNRVLSNVGTATAWLTTYKPPLLTLPDNNATAPSNAAQPLTFSWQASRHAGGTSAIMYRFELWEQRAEGVPAQTVAASVPPLYTTETSGQIVTVVPATLALEPGMRYCWCVTAFDPANMCTFENRGESEVRTFQYLEKCPEVSDLTVTLDDACGQATWNLHPKHEGGYNVELYNDDGTYHETLWGGTNKTACIGGEYGKTWHIRVQGICHGNVESQWTKWVDFTTLDAPKPITDNHGKKYECGEFPPYRTITNFTLRETLEKGDTLENERGSTKFIVYSATKNDDGSFRGLSYMKLSIWGVNVLGEYDHMRVNTDGVIVGRFSWHSVKSDKLLATPDSIEQWANELAVSIASASYNNTIRDTVVVDSCITFATIIREDSRYYAVSADGQKEEITSFINRQNRILVQDTEGHQLVIDKDGEPMGVAEYKECGSSKTLLRESIKNKDAQMSKTGNVKFFGTDDYLFDTYDTYDTYANHSAAEGYAKHFPAIGQTNYRPAYACAESRSNVQLRAEPYENITFKNERGVPVICNDGMLTIKARTDRDTTIIYAYNPKDEIVGKVNILSYDRITRKLCLVPIGNSQMPKAEAVKQELDRIFVQQLVDFEVTIANSIDINYKNGKSFTHGGSGVVGVYNTDQESAINKLKEQEVDNETIYLFMVSEATTLNETDSRTIVSGYMPRGYQFGFIYNELTNARTIAHELCHGAFHLRHTFDAADFIAQEGTTDNLMDYNHGKQLNHWQWKDMHKPKNVRFKWLQEESEGESVTTILAIYGANVALNASIQMLFAYMLDDNVNSWEEAWNEVSMWQALSDGAIDIIPIKKVRYALSFTNNFVQCLANKSEINHNSFVECGLLGLIDIVIGEAIEKYGLSAVEKGLRKIGFGEEKIENIVKLVDAEDISIGEITDIEANNIKKNTAVIAEKARASHENREKLRILVQTHSDGGKQFFEDFDGVGDDVICKFIDNPKLVETWLVIKNNHPIDSKDIDLLQRICDLREYEKKVNIGFTDEVITNIKSIFFSADDISAVRYDEVINTCYDFSKTIVDKKVTLNNLDKVLNELSKGKSFAAGAEWVVRYISKHGDEFANKKLTFEVVEEINGKTRRIDMVVEDMSPSIKGKKQTMFYEFKSVKKIPPSHFIEQFSKDLENKDITDLSQLKWVFDGKKVSQDELIITLKKSIDEWEVPNTITEKWECESSKTFKINKLNPMFDIIFKTY